MESINETYCVCCLENVGVNFQQFFIENEAIKLLFMTEPINLCYICYKIAKKLERFIQNVQCNQNLLKNGKTLLERSSQVKEQPLVQLSPMNLETIELSGNNKSESINEYQVFTSLKKPESFKVKIEIIAEHESNNLMCFQESVDACNDRVCLHMKDVKTEYPLDTLIDVKKQSKKQIKTRKKGKSKGPIVRKKAAARNLLKNLDNINLSINESSKTLDTNEVILNTNVQQCGSLNVKEEVTENNAVDFLSAPEYFDECNDNTGMSSPEEEDEYPLNLLMKAAIDANNLGKKIEGITKSKKKVRHKIKEENTANENGDEKQILEVISMTKEQCENERNERAKEDKYVHAQFKCTYCVLGFTFEMAYRRHMEKHSKSAGDFKCDICSLRSSSKSKLSMHMRSHEMRFRCLKCNIIRNDRQTIMEHYGIVHGNGRRHECPRCLKTYLRRLTLKRHLINVHSVTKPRSCPYCEKCYKNSDVLKSHMASVHEKEVYKKKLLKKHICQECGMSFRNPSQLKYHSIKHSRSRDHYCVECDKSFKSEHILRQHLKNTVPHVNYLDLPLACQQCDKRFAIKRDVERHMNRVHLNIRPFKCDQCSKSYINNWSLKEHKRLTHEGYKRPLKFQCEFCDKAFTRHQILKQHLRTHTGERPYECDKCSARFSQSNVLNTHIRLVHLKLTRDGRPKGGLK